MNPLHERLLILKHRNLALISELAEMKRAYLVDGVNGNPGKRATLEAALAKLAVDKFDTECELRLRKEASIAFKVVAFKAVMVEILTVRGLADLAVEAEKETMLRLDQAGMLLAYKSKTI